MEPLFDRWRPSDVDEAYAVVCSGGLALTYTHVGYALIGRSAESLRRMYELKERPLRKAVITLGNADSLRDMSSVMEEPSYERFILQLIPVTPLGLIVPIREQSRLLASLSPDARAMATVGETVAVFLSLGSFIDALVKRASADNLLLTATSANQSSHGNTTKLSDVPSTIREGVEVTVDLGPIKYADAPKLGSTVLNLISLTLHRSAINWESIEPQFADLQQQAQVRLTR
jgi:tRNA A37 threonylcarbamoyladenosine synthetase subunit TsaC/SUA5/YrdC